ncbi:hypothetical protein [Sorangium sp. So ce131]
MDPKWRQSAEEDGWSALAQGIRRTREVDARFAGRPGGAGEAGGGVSAFP